MNKINRRKFLLSTSAMLLTAGGFGWYKMAKKPPLGLEVDNELIQTGKDFLEKNIAIDIHAHPGRSFVKGAKDIDFKFNYYSLIGRFEDEAFADMKKGGFTASAFSTVSDYQLLTLGNKGLSARREFNTDEAWQSYQTQIATLKSLINNQTLQVLEPQDIVNAKAKGKIAVIFSAEGADFLQGS